MEKYDFVIAGGGAAGLSLAYHLARAPLGEPSVLVVDKDGENRDGRTWCFWTDQPTPFDAIVQRSWDRLRFVAEDSQSSIPLGSFRYHMIRGTEFCRFVRQELSSHPRVEFLRGRVQRIEDAADGIAVWVEGREYRGRWAFDSLFDWSRWDSGSIGHHSLLQHFKGWEIETPERQFDPRTATFMDFRTPQKGEVRFFYLLPISDRRALVEYVACAANPPQPGEAEDAFTGYLEGILGIDGYRILRREGGVSPMTDRPFPRRIGQRVLAIGARGGRIKPSTGYAFSRIQRDSTAIVRSLLRVGHPFQVPPDPRRYRLYDSLMLQIMYRHGERVKAILAALFKNNPIGRVLRFLDEAGSPWENLLLIASLPDPLFLRALFRLKVLLRV